MNTPMKIWSAIALLAAVAVLGCGGGSKNSLATVSGDSISRDDFYQHMMTKGRIRVIVQNQVVEVPVADTLAFQALQDLVTQQVIVQMATDEGLNPSDEEVEDEINFKKALQPTFLDDLKARGYTMGQIRRDIKADLCQERLLTKGIEVTAEEVDKLIEENPEQFMNAARADVYFVFVLNQEQMDEVDTALGSAQKFKAVAAQYSKTTGASESQGRYPIQVVNSMPEQVQNIVNSTAVGGVSDWIASGEGFAKFYIEGKTDAEPIDMTSQRKEYLRRQIAIDRGRAAKDLSAKVAERMRTADIKISEDDPTLEQLWDRYVDRLKQGETAPVEVDSTDEEDSE